MCAPSPANNTTIAVQACSAVTGLPRNSPSGLSLCKQAMAIAGVGAIEHTWNLVAVSLGATVSVASTCRPVTREGGLGGESPDGF